MQTTSTTGDLPIAAETTKQLSAFARYWRSINWDHVFSLLLNKLFSILIASLVLGLFYRVGNKIIRNSFEKYKQKDNYSENRVQTLYSLVSNIFQYTLFFIYAYALLSIMGIPVSSLLAGAGIAGVAIGLGAQGFINDFITGFFIILEKQIEVGDFVEIDTFQGTVQSVGLRTTQIKGVDGAIHFIPNRTILVISNLSKANRLVAIQLRVAPDTNIEYMKQLITDVNEVMVPLYPDIKTPPEIVGLIDLGNGNLALKIIMYTRNGSQIKIQSDFLEAYLTKLSENGIAVPQTPLILTPK
ncbi:mechanosensitive ion channel family protein [Vagococcus lutrae]|uniref:mechanosensitive ion channel family protein n=1 Tax=Vagococcus lutrae TaxID=81947 RepID=UPI001FFB64C2|nr:mechanosensitive ion channel family protein [Vagococcus lutrae]